MQTKITIGISDLETSQNVLTRSDAEKAYILAVFFSSAFAHQNTDEIPSIQRNGIDNELTQHCLN